MCFAIGVLGFIVVELTIKSELPYRASLRIIVAKKAYFYLTWLFGCGGFNDDPAIKFKCKTQSINKFSFIFCFGNSDARP